MLQIFSAKTNILHVSSAKPCRLQADLDLAQVALIGETLALGLRFSLMVDRLNLVVLVSVNFGAGLTAAAVSVA